MDKNIKRNKRNLAHFAKRRLFKYSIKDKTDIEFVEIVYDK